MGTAHRAHARAHPHAHPPTHPTHSGGRRPHHSSPLPPKTRREPAATAQGRAGGGQAAFGVILSFPPPQRPSPARDAPDFFPPPAKMLKISPKGRPAAPRLVLPFVSQRWLGREGGGGEGKRWGEQVGEQPAASPLLTRRSPQAGRERKSRARQHPARLGQQNIMFNAQRCNNGAETAVGTITDFFELPPPPTTVSTRPQNTPWLRLPTPVFLGRRLSSYFIPSEQGGPDNKRPREAASPPAPAQHPPAPRSRGGGEPASRVGTDDPPTHTHTPHSGAPQPPAHPSPGCQFTTGKLQRREQRFFPPSRSISIAAPATGREEVKKKQHTNKKNTCYLRMDAHSESDMP